ncbi:MAG: type I-C CRISPR-associated protein Cas8c/Csd1 [Acidobacteriota bacterium]
MLVQALAGYADHYLKEQLDDLAFEEKPLRYWVEIGDGGRYLGLSERTSQIEVGRPGKKKAATQVESFLVPKSPVNRNSGIHPLLGCDALQYVLGPEAGAWTQPKDIGKHRGHHTRFVELIRQAAQETKDAGLRACAPRPGRQKASQRGHSGLVLPPACPGRRRSRRAGLRAAPPHGVLEVSF